MFMQRIKLFEKFLYLFIELLFVSICEVKEMQFLIKNFGIFICGFYCYDMLVQEKINRNQIIKVILLSFVCSFFIILFERLNIVEIMMMILLLSCICNVIVFNKLDRTTIVVTILSVAISYMLFVVSGLLTVLITLFMNSRVYNEYCQLICFLIQMCVMPIPFIPLRTKRGMQFINKRGYAFFLIFLSFIVLIISFFINKEIGDITVYLIYVVLILIISILFMIGWRTSITRHYLERLSLRNIDSLNNELDEKNALIKRLIEDKDRIEKLNHKNYKLVPAMQGAVMHYLTGVKEYMDIVAQTPAFNEMTATGEGALTGDKLNGFIDEGNRLIEELKKMSSEWTEFVNNENLTGDKEISSCGIPRVDYILSYMHDRSLKEGFSLKIDIEQSVDKLTEKIISEEDVATLVADLIENAIIATRHNNREDILVRLGVMKKEFILEVYDSGTPFDKDVLAKYGKEKITTHADDNGSGIGMMQTYEILGKCGASLYIDELSEESGLYTKRISIVFNKKNQYVLYTKRSDDEIAYLHKRSDMMIIRK